MGGKGSSHHLRRLPLPVHCFLTSPKSLLANMEMHTDLKRLEQELNYEILPGTEVMTDTSHVSFVKSGDTVLIPQPSSNPEDPLNWTPFWKSGAVVCSVLLGFIQGAFGSGAGYRWGAQPESSSDYLCDHTHHAHSLLLGAGFGPLSLSSQIPYYVADFDRSVNDIVNLIGVGELLHTTPGHSRLLSMAPLGCSAVFPSSHPRTRV